MSFVMLKVSSLKSHIYCSHRDLEFLKLFLFEDQAAFAKHCSTTHHKRACPVVMLLINQYIMAMHRQDEL